jgi:hypothetical protein
MLASRFEENVELVIKTGHDTFRIHYEERVYACPIRQYTKLPKAFFAVY